MRESEREPVAGRKTVLARAGSRKAFDSGGRARRGAKLWGEKTNKPRQRGDRSSSKKQTKRWVKNGRKRSWKKPGVFIVKREGEEKRGTSFGVYWNSGYGN